MAIEVRAQSLGFRNTQLMLVFLPEIPPSEAKPLLTHPPRSVPAPDIHCHFPKRLCWAGPFPQWPPKQAVTEKPWQGERKHNVHLFYSLLFLKRNNRGTACGHTHSLGSHLCEACDLREQKTVPAGTQGSSSVSVWLLSLPVLLPQGLPGHAAGHKSAYF